MNQSEMVIFTRTFDLLTWLLPVTNHFPRAYRHTFTARLLNCAFDLRERWKKPTYGAVQPAWNGYGWPMKR